MPAARAVVGLAAATLVAVSACSGTSPRPDGGSAPTSNPPSTVQVTRSSALAPASSAPAVAAALPPTASPAERPSEPPSPAEPPTRSAGPTTPRAVIAVRSNQPAAGTLRGRVVVLDPGHNLNDSPSINAIVNAGNGVRKACDTVGTSTNAGYPEHAFTWDVANRAAAILRAAGATVILTRSSDSGIGPCITTRAQIGNNAHADAFVAIHADGGPTSGHGFFVMQPPPNNPNVNPGAAARSRVLATTMHDVFHAATGIAYSSYIANGYYPNTTTTGTINLSHGPVITIECLNMRNAGDAAIATNPAGRQRIAAGIAAGITAFLTTK